MISFTQPGRWPESRPARFASTITSGEVKEEAPCRVALLGLADDTGVKLNGGRAGAKDGPAAFRAALARYGVHSPAFEKAYPAVLDAGDVVPGADIEETHARVTTAVGEILALGMFPVGIGGGHDLTFPLVRAVARARTAMGETTLEVLYVDAHLDVREEVGSGMPIRRLIEDCGAGPLTCIGLDHFVNTREHVEWFRSHGGRIVDGEMASRDWPACFRAGTGSMSVSIDLDCLDSAYAPGVSAVNPNGMTPRDVAACCYQAGLSPRVRCFDIMELNPALDQDGRTARVAAHLFLAFLRGLSERTEAAAPPAQ